MKTMTLVLAAFLSSMAVRAWSEERPPTQPPQPAAQPGEMPKTPAVGQAAKEEAARILAAPVPGSLDDMLAMALTSNPEILEAETKVRQAQARWNQTRLRVVQAVIAAFHETMLAENLIRAGEERLEQAKAMAQTGQASQSAVTEATAAYMEARGRLEQARANIRYLLGLGGSVRAPEPEARADVGARVGAPQAPPGPSGPAGRERPAVPGKIQAMLEKEVAVSLQDAPLRQTLDELRALSGGEFDFLLDTELDPDAFKITLNLSKARLRSVFAALVDLYPIRFVVRDYGILVTHPDRAGSMFAPTIPEDLPLAE